jgi:hypothetical protein
MRVNPAGRLKGTEMRRARSRAEASEIAERRQRDWLDMTLTRIGDAVIAADQRSIVTCLNPVA